MSGPGEQAGVILLPAVRDGSQIRGIGLEEDAVLRVTQREGADVVGLLEREHAADAEVRAEHRKAFEELAK